MGQFGMQKRGATWDLNSDVCIVRKVLRKEVVAEVRYDFFLDSALLTLVNLLSAFFGITTATEEG